MSTKCGIILAMYIQLSKVKMYLIFKDISLNLAKNTKNIGPKPMA
jgi:hypothetical protein